MQTNPNTNIEHIIAKIDNDFNIDHSDWIPRVAAWVIEALSLLKCTKYETVTKKITITDRIGIVDGVDLNQITVCDKNGCKIESMEDVIGYGKCCKIDSYDIIGRDEQIAIPIDPTQYPEDHVTTSRLNSYKKQNRYYVIIKPNKIELNFDTDYIYVKYKSIKTEIS